MNINTLPRLYAGVDEAGRGPLAGPVAAAAVILDPARPIAGLNDSKLLRETVRESLSEQIKAQALAWSIAYADVAEIAQLNILQATLLAMQRAVVQLAIIPELVLIDGRDIPRLTMPAQAIIKGDQLIPAISAASILAKVARDALMRDYARRYPQYELARHKGYGTLLHRQLLKLHGPSPIHRKSFLSFLERE